MGGSGGGGFHGGGYSDKSSTTACEDISQETQLYSPSREVLRKLTASAKLEIQCKDETKLFALYHNEIAGSILTQINVEIINCILTKGVKFYAIVKSIDGGNCQVLIQAEK